MRLTICLVMVLLWTVSSANAEMYKWIDDKGVVTFKDTPPPSKKKKAKVYKDSDFAAPAPAPVPQSAVARQPASARQAPAPQPAPYTAHKVEVYMTSWCGYCKKTINYLKQKGVAYAAYDIEGDPAAHERYRALGGQGVPLVVIGSNKIAGYSPAAMDHYLQSP